MTFRDKWDVTSYYAGGGDGSAGRAAVAVAEAMALKLAQIEDAIFQIEDTYTIFQEYKPYTKEELVLRAREILLSELEAVR